MSVFPDVVKFAEDATAMEVDDLGWFERAKFDEVAADENEIAHGFFGG